MNKNITPESLFKELSTTVIGQTDYLKALCNAAWLHNLRYEYYKKTGKAIIKPKQNILCIGASGTGKTLAVEELGKILDLPVIIENASVLRGEGWKGRNVSSLIPRCIDAAPNKDMATAIHSIVCLDEIDKVFKSHLNDRSFLPIDNLLTFLAGGVVTYSENNRNCMMDTSSLFIICLGAFEGLNETIQTRLSGKNSIGFSMEKQKELPEGNLLQYVTEDDLHKYGISHEFLGRISHITHTNPLTCYDYKRILSDSPTSPVKQYNELLLKTLGVRVEIMEDAVDYLARLAVNTNEGARMLARMVSELLQPQLFTIAQNGNMDAILIDCLNGKLRAYQAHVGIEINIEDNPFTVASLTAV